MPSGAISFNGVNNYIELSNNPTSVVNNFTILGWIKPVLPSTTSIVYYNGNDAGGYGIGVGVINDSGSSGSKLIGLYGLVTWLDTDLILENDVWQHVALVRRAGVTWMFLNGVGQNITNSTPNTPTTGRATIGCQLSPGNNPYRFYRGKVDEFKIYDKAFSDDEIIADYNSGQGTFGRVTDPFLKVGFHFDEIIGTKVFDYSPSALVGRLKGTSLPVFSPSGVVTDATSYVQKHFMYKVFDAGTYKGVWTQEVLNDPKFRTNINAAAGELVVQLARSFDDFGEDDDVKLNNRVDCYVVDKEAPNSSLLYSGYISGYRPIIQKSREFLEVTLFSYAAEFGRMILRDGSGNTTIAYSSVDPAAMLRDVIDKYRSILGGTINYTASSIQNTNTSVSYTFNDNTVKEVIDKIIELCPVGWYWRVDPDNTIYLKPKNVLSDHTFTLGVEVENLETFRRIEDLVNRVLFTGGGDPALFRKYENTGSQATYGLYEKRIIDQRVTDASTASVISNRVIDNQKDPEIRSKYRLIDSNGKSDQLGVDVENIKVGQTIKVSNLDTGVDAASVWDVAQWDVDVWDQTLSTTAADVIQILSVEYEPDSIVLEASSRLPQIAKRIEDINRNLENSQTINNPAAPT